MLRLYEMNANEKERRDGVRFTEGVHYQLSIVNFLTLLHFGELRKIMRKRFHSA